MRHTLIIVVAVLLASCSPDAEPAETTLADTTTTTRAEITTTTVAPPFGVSSPAFAEGAGIPTVHTCDGSDMSPELNVVGIPEGTNSIVVIVDDLDAPLGTWDHWVEYDIPTTGGSLVIPGGADQAGVPGINSWNLEGYKGPCPPPGEQHTYHFRLYAIQGKLGLPHGVDSATVREAMEGVVLDEVELTGTYAR